MSFRSHTRTTQPMVPRRRSLSNSRVPTSTPIGSSNYSYYNGNPSYTSRPLSGGYYPAQTSVYQSPYTNMYGSRDNLYNHSTRNGYYPNGSYDMRYGSNAYGSDRYISPYTSYDHGITTAGLSLSVPGKGYSHKNSSYTSIPNNSIKHDYTPPRNSNLLKTKSLSTSNTNVNSYPSTKVSVGTNTQTALVPRSQSLRDQERKSRTRSRNRSVAAATRSMSASSEKSEGYESGSEKASRSRLGSTSSLADGEQSDNKKDTSENGEVIDYKALWEAVKLENDKLKQMLKKKDDELVNTKATVEKFTSATTKNSLSELEKRERRAMERKLSEMEEELKHLDILKTENQRLKEENGALIRVISKLSK